MNNAQSPKTLVMQSQPPHRTHFGQYQASSASLHFLLSLTHTRCTSLPHSHPPSLPHSFTPSPPTLTPSLPPTLSYLFFPPLLHMCSPLPSPLQRPPPTFIQLLWWRLMKAVIRCQAHHRFGGLHHLKCVHQPFARDVQRVRFLQRYYNQGGVFLRPSSLSLQGCFWWGESGEGWGGGGACWVTRDETDALKEILVCYRLGGKSEYGGGIQRRREGGRSVQVQGLFVHLHSKPEGGTKGSSSLVDQLPRAAQRKKIKWC